MTVEPPPPPAYQPAAPPKKSHWVRNLFIVLAVLLVLMIGGCVAFLAGVADEVDESVQRGKTESGGTENPLTITPGKAFEVRGLNYLADWKLSNNEFGDMQVENLRVTNNRDKRDSVIVEIKVWKGTEVVALADCTTEPIQPKTTTKLSCLSADTLEKGFTKVTINDAF